MGSAAEGLFHDPIRDASLQNRNRTSPPAPICFGLELRPAASVSGPSGQRPVPVSVHRERVAAALECAACACGAGIKERL